MTIEDYFRDWMSVISKPLLIHTLSSLSLEYKCYSCLPSKSNIFKAFEYFDYKDLKVVFLGQDPYPQKDVATGLLFGNKRNSLSISPSLKVIKEAVVNPERPHGIIEFDNSLELWAQQGILLLNSALSVRQNSPGSHELLWRPFIKNLLTNILIKNPRIPMVLFGRVADTFSPFLKDAIILKEQHPAFYARNKQRMPNTVFEEVSKIIKAQYGTPIIWYKEENL